MIIDCHHHLGKEPDYVEKLVRECKRLKIDKVCLMGIPDYYGHSTNSQVKDAFNKYPGLLIGFALVNPYRISSNYMKPIYLDTIARIFPRLTIIGAHLGNPWYEEATMSARWNPNLYFDLSGSILKKKTPEFLGGLLWWTPQTRYRDPEGRYAWEKILFGSDVPYHEIEEVMADYKGVLNKLKINQEIQDGIFGGTMAKILKL